jgi:membrane-associated tyrosine/threonine-specific cdc2-inhibitory kinase
MTFIKTAHIPDFGFEDDLHDYSPPLCPQQGRELTPDECELLTAHDLIIDHVSPIKCTANSTVYSAHSPRDGRRWAVKVAAQANRIDQEYANRRKIRDCPYILKAVALHPSPTRPVMKMELCENGDLRGIQLEEPDIWELIHDVGTALALIHGDGWMHLDVSPGNILIGSSCFKLSDFGTLARVGDFAPGMEGASPYVSPEALRAPHGPAVTGQTDIFSFGLVLLEVATRAPAPRGGSKRYTEIRSGLLRIGTGQYPCRWSQTLIDVINAMIDPDPNHRPTAWQLVEIAGLVANS